MFLIDSQSIFENNAGLSEKKYIQLKKNAFSHKYSYLITKKKTTQNTHTKTCNMLLNYQKNNTKHTHANMQNASYFFLCKKEHYYLFAILLNENRGVLSIR